MSRIYDCADLCSRNLVLINSYERVVCLIVVRLVRYRHIRTRKVNRSYTQMLLSGTSKVMLFSTFGVRILPPSLHRRCEGCSRLVVMLTECTQKQGVFCDTCLSLLHAAKSKIQPAPVPIDTKFVIRPLLNADQTAIILRPVRRCRARGHSCLLCRWMIDLAIEEHASRPSLSWQ